MCECIVDEDCENDNECTIDICDTDFCTNIPVANGTVCDDGLYCTVNDQCLDGECISISRDCDDSLFCTGIENCNEETDQCESNGNPCPEIECDTCQEDIDSCFDPLGAACTDDGNVCTDDECNGTGSCVHPNNSAPCDDGFFCNGTDTCNGGICTHEGDPCLPLDCD